MSIPTRRTGPAKGLSYQELLDTDSRPVPPAYRWEAPPEPGPQEIPVSRYLDRSWHEREKQQLWARCWQVACRESELAEVGSTAVYDIADRSYLLVRAHEGDDGIVAFPNACLHRGRALRDGAGRVTELECAFHGFCWSLDGKLKRIPSAWDFPQVTPHGWQLPSVQVGTWGGFVLINPDPDCEPLQSYVGVLPELFERWPLDRRYTRAHVSKVVKANWKLVQEAFMESYHVVTTHPQLLPGFGDANSQYDVWGNVSRAISPRGVASPLLAWDPTEQQRLDSALDRREDDPLDVAVPEGSTARLVLADSARKVLSGALGDDVEKLCDAELVDSIFMTLYPNFHPWGTYNQIAYRFRPYGDDHQMSVMDVWLLAPYSGERPEDAAEVRLGADEQWIDAVEVLGSLARVFDQDEFNLAAVQKGLAATQRPTLSLSDYQESKIRHFYRLYEHSVGAPSGLPK